MIRFALSEDARRLADLFIATSPGATVTFAQLTAALGRDVKKARHLIASAQRTAQREAGASFVNVITVGYKRLAPGEVASRIGPAARKRIRGEARRASGAIVAAVSVGNDLTPEEGRRANAEMAVLGMIEHIAGDRHVAQMQRTASPLASRPPVVSREMVEQLLAV